MEEKSVLVGNPSTKADIFSIVQLWRFVFLEPMGVQRHNVPHFKGLIGAKVDLEVQGRDSTFTFCHAHFKIGIKNGLFFPSLYWSSTNYLANYFILNVFALLFLLVSKKWGHSNTFVFGELGAISVLSITFLDFKVSNFKKNCNSLVSLGDLDYITSLSWMKGKRNAEVEETFTFYKTKHQISTADSRSLI